MPPAYVEFVDDMVSATPLSVLAEFIPQFDLLDKFHVVDAFERVPTSDHVRHRRQAHLDRPRPQAARPHRGLPACVECEGAGHMPILEFKDEVNDEPSTS